MNTNIQILRKMISELRQVLPERRISDNLGVRYIFDQFRKYKTTDQHLCKAQEEVKFIANTYLCYLRSSRKYQEINREYRGKGERTIQETADMVGFKLPHDPK